MSFVLKSTSHCGRVGVISSIERLKSFEIETPHVFLYTQSGAVPHLTHEVLQMVTETNLGLNIPIQGIAHIHKPIKLFKHCIADYIGMSEYLTYCSFINPLGQNMNNSYTESGIGLYTRNGRECFSPDSYMKFIEDLKPDMFLLLADGGTHLNSSKKRTVKSFNNSVAFFEKCQEIYKKSVPLKKSLTLGAIEGGFDLSLRQQFSKLIGESSVFGVVIDGLHDCSETVADISFHDVKPFVKASLEHIPEDKLRIIHGCWSPNVVLDLIELGIDMFDSSYISLVTSQKSAFIFPNAEDFLDKHEFIGVKDENYKKNTNDINIQNQEASDKMVVTEPLLKKIKLETKPKFFISMLDPCHATDFSPISKNCTCLTCQNHTRAYLYHLVNVKEMLGDTLLMIHNLHHYLIFLSTIRKTLKSGKFQDFKKNLQMWLHEKNEIKLSSEP